MNPFDRWPTPLLAIDLGAAARNIASVLQEMGAANRWRPHVKTAKVAEAMDLYLDAGVMQFKCATLLEAQVLGSRRSGQGAGPRDVLVAHHLFGPALGALAELQAGGSGTTYSTLVEDPSQLPAIPEPLGVFIDLDLGMHRTGLGIERTEEIVALAKGAGARFRGLHAYDGHRHEADPAERERLAHGGYERLMVLCEILDREGAPVEEVVTSGTPSYPASLSYGGWGERLHRASPGTVIYHDMRTRDQLPDARPEFAATVLTRVVSLPSDDLFTVDAGSKAIEAADPGRIAEALGLPDAVAVRQSEEHTVFRIDRTQRPGRGTLLRLVPGHVCPTVNLAERCALMDGERFLGMAPVAARGHSGGAEL